MQDRLRPDRRKPLATRGRTMHMGQTETSTGRLRMSLLPSISDIAPHSLDHFVGAREKSIRHGQSECLGGLEINDQLHLCGLNDRQVGRLLTLENPAGIDAD